MKGNSSKMHDYIETNLLEGVGRDIAGWLRAPDEGVDGGGG